MARTSPIWLCRTHLHPHKEQPQGQPEFSVESHHQARIGNGTEGGQQQGLKEPDQHTDSVEHQQDAQEAGKGAGFVDQIAQGEQPGAKEQLSRDPAHLVDVDGLVRQPFELCRRLGLHDSIDARAKAPVMRCMFTLVINILLKALYAVPHNQG